MHIAHFLKDMHIPWWVALIRCPTESPWGTLSYNTGLSFQMVWATTNKIGCAVHTCRSMNVWGDIWENAVYLVCNYSPK